MVSPIVVALDFPSLAEASSMARMVKAHVGAFKVGLELLWAEGPGVIPTIAGLGLPVFVDAKLHDIPNTVNRAARELGVRGARWVTVHATGGSAMIEAAVAGIDAGSSEAGILAVTVLTSIDEATMATVGIQGPVNRRVASLSALAASVGAEGVVCSVAEVPFVKSAARELLAVTPGIRATGSAPDDQARVATPEAAMAAGADLLVIGRPITRSPDPEAAAAAIAEEVAPGRSRPTQ